MSQNHALIAELKMESANTRKILSRVPAEQNGWQPHEKSMKLGRIAGHVAELTGWVALVLNTDELDFASGAYIPVTPATNEELLAFLDKCTNESIAALEKATDADFDKMWTMRFGDHVIMTLPKKVVIRSAVMSHIVHHRGQMTVYLRLLGIPVPGIYGPTADEQ